MNHVQVTSLEQLKALARANDGVVDVFFMLGGCCRSSKDIRYDGGGRWDVFHSISDAWSEYETDEEFVKWEDHIMKAMEIGCLYAYASQIEEVADGGQ